MKDSLRKFVYTILYPTTLFFTIIVLMFSAISTTAETTYSVPVVSPSGLLLILLFSIVFACLNRIFSIKSMNLFGRILLHYVGTLLAFTVIFVFIGNNFLNSSKGTEGRVIFILLGALSVIYIVTAAIILIFRAVIRKSSGKNIKNKKTEYKSQFRKN